MKRWTAKALSVVRGPAVWDALAVAGLVLLVLGVALVHVPTALVVLGFAMLVVAALAASQQQDEIPRPNKRRRHARAMHIIGQASEAGLCARDAQLPDAMGRLCADDEDFEE